MNARRALSLAPLLLMPAGAGLITGCMSAPPYERPATSVPTAWRETPPQGNAALVAADRTEDRVAYPPAAWWLVFGDPELERLIAAAQRNNHELKAAASRVAQAEAQARAAAAELYPSLAGSTSGDRDGRGGSRLDPSYQAGLQAEYEADFWGRNRATADSAGAAIEANRFDRETIALRLTAEVATTYFQQLALSDRLASARQQRAIAG